MKAIIIKQDLGREYYTGEKCHITELSNTIDDPEVSIARARVEPGVTHNGTGLREPRSAIILSAGRDVWRWEISPPRRFPPGILSLFRPCVGSELPISGLKI